MQLVKVTPTDGGAAVKALLTRWEKRGVKLPEPYANLVEGLEGCLGYGFALAEPEPRSQFVWRWEELDHFAAHYNLDVSEPLRCAHCNAPSEQTLWLCRAPQRGLQPCCGCVHEPRDDGSETGGEE